MSASRVSILYLIYFGSLLCMEGEKPDFRSAGPLSLQHFIGIRSIKEHFYTAAGTSQRELIDLSSHDIYISSQQTKQGLILELFPSSCGVNVITPWGAHCLISCKHDNVESCRMIRETFLKDKRLRLSKVGSTERMLYGVIGIYNLILPLPEEDRTQDFIETSIVSIIIQQLKHLVENPGSCQELTEQKHPE